MTYLQMLIGCIINKKKMEIKKQLEELDSAMYNLNANLSALIYIQKLKTLEEAKQFMQVINGEIAKWIKVIREIHQSMGGQT